MDTGVILERAARALGYPGLSDEQKDVLEQFVAGSDVFVSLPTGSGKTTCYAALPIVYDILLHRDTSNLLQRSIAIVVSPLLALIRDQMTSLAAKGLAVGAVTSESNEEEKTRVSMGSCQIVFFSPESLILGSRWRKILNSEVYYSRIIAFVIDEAHCVTEWGGDFRVEYSKLQQIRSIFHSSVHVMALTATATKTMRQEISFSLGMKDFIVVSRSPDKPNIRYMVKEFETIEKTFGPMVEQIASFQAALSRTIIFCPTITDCCSLYKYFRNKLGTKFTVPNGSQDRCKNRVLDMFHSDVEPSIKKQILTNFVQPSHHLRVLIATTAFGLGVDVPNIRTVIHFGSPKHRAEYIQAIGRAGRDKQTAVACLLVRKVKNNGDMIAYSENDVICRRKVLFNDYDEVERMTSGCFCCDICSIRCECDRCFQIEHDNILFSFC